MRVTNAPASRKTPHPDDPRAKGFRMRRFETVPLRLRPPLTTAAPTPSRPEDQEAQIRALWQIRINAAARAAGTTYSRFMEGLKAAKVALDRKILADLAATDAAAFTELVKVARTR